MTSDRTGKETSRRAQGPSIETSRVMDSRDSAGRATAWTWRTTSGAMSSAAGYDAAGHLASQSGVGWSSANSYTYSPDSGKKTAENLPVAYPSASCTSSYSYTPEGRLATATIAGTKTDYCYNQAGSIATVTVGANTQTTDYRSASRITTIWDGGSVSTTFTLDGRGRRIYQGPTLAPTRIRYSWDNSDRLTRYQDSSASVAATFTYDASGQRLTSVVTNSGASTSTTYTYDGLALLRLESRTGTATTTLRYLYDDAGRPYAGLITLPSTSTRLFGMVTTDRGDVIELTDAAGTPFAFYRYDAYGRPTQTLSTGTALIPTATAARIASLQPLRYAGYCFDEFSGQYYLSARYYDPVTCQFLTKDPAKDDGEESAYQYCGGDPVGNVDPSGLYKGNVGFAWKMYKSNHWDIKGEPFWKDKYFVHLVGQFWARYRKTCGGACHKGEDPHMETKLVLKATVRDASRAGIRLAGDYFETRTQDTMEEGADAGEIYHELLREKVLVPRKKGKTYQFKSVPHESAPNRVVRQMRVRWTRVEGFRTVQGKGYIAGPAFVE